MKAFTIQTANGPVSGYETGNGPPVILLAGLGSTTRVWGNLPAALGRRLRVITIDNRGVGRSADGAAFTLDAAADDLAAVLDAKKIDRTALLGASMGGVIALKTASAHPDRISRMVVASAAARLSNHGRRVLEMFQDLLLYAPPDRAGAALMTMAFAPPFHERFPGFVAETDRLYGIAEADLPGTLAQIEHLRLGWDLRSELAGIEAPTLVLAGERDPVVAVEDTAEVADAVPNAELLRVPGAAHSVLAEGGEPLLARVEAFLDPGMNPATSATV